MTPLAIGLVGVTLAGGLYALDRVANRIVRPTPRLPPRSVPDTGLEHEDLTIESGAHPLAAWLLRGREVAPEPAATDAAQAGVEPPLFVLAHGWGASYGTVLLLAEPLAEAGLDVLLFDMRGHGRNRAVPYVTVRQLRDDVMTAVRYAHQRFPHRPIVLVGHSFGGAASVLAVAEGTAVAGLVLIATPADIVRITAEYLSDHGAPGGLMATLLRPFWWWRLGGSFLPHSPARRIGEIVAPLLIIQPEHDRRVHRRHAEDLAKAAGASYHVVQGRGHTDVLGAPETLQLVLELAERARRGPLVELR